MNDLLKIWDTNKVWNKNSNERLFKGVINNLEELDFYLNF